MHKSKTNNNRLLWQAMSMAGSLGFVIAMPMILFTILGFWLDKLLASTPIITIGGTLLGTLAGVYLAIKQVKNIK